MGADKKLCRGVIGEISRKGDDTMGAGSAKPTWLVSGELREEKGQLRGWSEVTAGGFGWHIDATDDIAVFEWVVTGPGVYNIVVKHDRAGLVRESVQI